MTRLATLLEGQTIGSRAAHSFALIVIRWAQRTPDSDFAITEVASVIRGALRPADLVFQVTPSELAVFLLKHRTLDRFRISCKNQSGAPGSREPCDILRWNRVRSW